MVADAALGRSAADVVLDAMAGEDLDVAVVEGDREVDGELSLRNAQDAAHAVIEVELLGGVVELRLGHGPDVRNLRHLVLDRHRGAGCLLARSRGRGASAVWAEAGRVRGDGCRFYRTTLPMTASTKGPLG